MQDYDGFMPWAAYESCEEAALFADVGLWRNLECAKTAAQKVLTDPSFKAVMAEIDSLVSMAITPLIVS